MELKGKDDESLAREGVKREIFIQNLEDDNE